MNPYPTDVARTKATVLKYREAALGEREYPMIEFEGFPAEFARRYREAGYWRGETLGGLLREWAALPEPRTAIVEGTRRWSYAELDARADRLAAGLRGWGIGPGTPVVVQLPNTADFAVVSIALFRLGAPPVFALPNHRRAEITYLCEAAGAVAYIIPDVHQGFDYRALATDVGAQRSGAPARVRARGPGPVHRAERRRGGRWRSATGAGRPRRTSRSSCCPGGPPGCPS